MGTLFPHFRSCTGAAASALLLGFAVAVALAAAAGAALPPLSPQELEADARLVVTGSVRSVAVSSSGTGDMVDRVEILQVQVRTVTKGDGARPGDTIAVRCWVPEKRPPGWVGPAGCGRIPKPGERVRLWLLPDGEARWVPLEPNGIRVLREPEEGDDD